MPRLRHHPSTGATSAMSPASPADAISKNPLTRPSSLIATSGPPRASTCTTVGTITRASAGPAMTL